MTDRRIRDLRRLLEAEAEPYSASIKIERPPAVICAVCSASVSVRPSSSFQCRQAALGACTGV
jgi:hypothetical protein